MLIRKPFIEITQEDTLSAYPQLSPARKQASNSLRDAPVRSPAVRRFLEDHKYELPPIRPPIRIFSQFNATKFFEIMGAGLKGLGVFATQDIPAGTCFLIEDPTMLIHKATAQIKQNDVLVAYSKLDGDKRRRFDSLRDVRHHKPQVAASRHLELPEAVHLLATTVTMTQGTDQPMYPPQSSFSTSCSQALQPADLRRCRDTLVALPPELRVHIYGYCLDDRAKHIDSEDGITITPVFHALSSVCEAMKKEILEDRCLTPESYYTGFNSGGKRVEREHDETDDTSGTSCRYCTGDDSINITVAWTIGACD
nr:hypothetical protein B0A51_06176 [Rachicladosporium sp. CCFEE 5018]